LIGKGYELCLYDPNVRLSQLVGANRQQILTAIPHIARLMVDTAEDVIAHSDLILIGTADFDYPDLRLQLAPHKAVIDMAGLGPRGESSERYDGINW
jgi:GDP-mannose 6-dehydrogenase